MPEDLNNGIIQSVIGAILFALIIWGVGFVRFRIDETKIVKFIRGSEYTFRSTEAIVASTNLSKSRVEHVCSKSKSIRRNEKERESWKVVK